MTYSTVAIRELISAAFNAEELETFCYDHFQPVYKDFTIGQTQSLRAQLLIGFAERRGQLDELLGEIAKANPHQFELFKDKVRAGPSTQQPDLPPVEAAGVEAAGGEQGGPRIGSIDLRGSQGAVISPSGPVTQTFGPMIDTGGGAYVGGNVATGGGDFIGRDRISKATGGATPEQFAALLAELRAALAQAKLDADERPAAEGDLVVLETQAGKPQPKLSVIESKLSSIKTLLEGAAGAGMAATGLAQVV